MSQNILSQLRRQYNYVKKGLIWGKNNLIKVTNKKCNGHEKWELVTFLLHAFTTITGIAGDTLY